MKIPDHLRPFIMPTAWLATAALTFGLGRLTSYVDAGPESHGPGGAHASLGSGNSNLGFSTDGMSLNLDGKVVGQTGPVRSVEELTQGKPVGDWLKNLLSQDDEITRMTGFLMLLERVNTPDEFKQALATTMANNGGGRGGFGAMGSRETSMLLQKWTKIDAKAAMEFVQGLDDRGGAKFQGMATVLGTWAKSNPQEAIAWAKSSAAAAAAEAAADDTAGGNGGGGPGGRGRDTNWAMSAVINQIARTDVGQALELAQGETAGRGRNMLSGTLVNQLVAQRGQDGAKDAILALNDEALRNSMLRQMSSRIANEDPQKALTWASSLPAGDGRNGAMADAIGEWAQRDASAAATYMTTLGTGPETDATRRSFALSVVRTDPAGAAAWANTITNPETRATAVTQVVSGWARSDAQAARQWVQSSTLPEETKTQVLAATTNNNNGGGGGGQGFQRGNAGGAATGTTAPAQGQGRQGGRRGGGGGGGG